jgi:hypothetical protein
MPDKWEQWCLLELYGHQRLAGLVTEATIGGCSFIRVDVPPDGDSEGFTRYYGNGAIYSMTPCTEDVARAMVSMLKPRPLTIYDISGLKALAEPERSAEDYDEEDY